jgi:hypothetical protein
LVVTRQGERCGRRLAFGIIYTIREGQIIRAEEHYAKAEALEAVGLSE